MRAAPRALSLVALAALGAGAATLVAPPSPVFVPRERSRVHKLTALPPPSTGRVSYPLAALDLPKSLDAVREAGAMSLGGKTYTVGVAADRDFKYFFAALTRDGVTKLEPIARPRDFMHDGVVLPVDGRPYLLKVALRLTAPVHGSELRIRPTDASPGHEAVWSTGELLDLLARRAAYFNVGRQEYRLAYMSDLDPSTGKPTGTRSFLFFRDGRFRPRAWALDESEVPDGGRVSISLGETRIVLERRKDLLVVRTPEK